MKQSDPYLFDGEMRLMKGWFQIGFAFMGGAQSMSQMAPQVLLGVLSKFFQLGFAFPPRHLMRQPFRKCC